MPAEAKPNFGRRALGGFKEGHAAYAVVQRRVLHFGRHGQAGIARPNRLRRLGVEFGKVRQIALEVACRHAGDALRSGRGRATAALDQLPGLFQR